MRLLFVVVGVVAYLGLAIAVGRYLKSRSAPLETEEPDDEEPIYNVFWRGIGQMQHAIRGTITFLGDDDYIVVSTDEDYPTVIDCRDIISVSP